MAGQESMSGDAFEPDELREHELMNDFRFIYLGKYLASCYKAVLDAQTDVLEVPVMRESNQPRPAWVLARGQYDSPCTDENLALRQAPAALPPLPAGLPANRLGLAGWLTRPDHPLTARVAVNRLWRNFLGAGLVDTMNDFGLQGSPPSHPRLLDWLARDFVDSGWDVKRFCKQLVLSSTYRQESVVSADLRANDPHNRLLARGPVRRLTAEMIRDLVLFAAGTLETQTGGPPVSPYQPANLWSDGNSMTPAYQQSVGRDLYRRSLYTVWKRSSPMPNMDLFDAAGREVCTLNRSRTNTPLQALVLLNDPQFVEAARVLAERTLAEQGEAADACIRMMFVTLTGRQPDPREGQLLLELFEDQLPWFEEHPDEARQLLTIGERPPDPDLSAARVAATTIVAQAIISCDATVWCR